MVKGFVNVFTAVVHLVEDQIETEIYVTQGINSNF